MKELELRALIDIYKFRIARDEPKIEHYKNLQKTAQRIYADCGTRTHQLQTEQEIKEFGRLALLHEKDVNKWKKELEKEEKNLLYLTKKKV